MRREREKHSVLRTRRFRRVRNVRCLRSIFCIDSFPTVCRAGRPWSRGEISPRLIRQALGVHPTSQSVVVAMDTTRVGPWEVWLAGIVVGGRTLPIGWAVLPYPWPQGRYRAAPWRWSLNSKRRFLRRALECSRGPGLSERSLFAQLRAGGTDFSVRLRLNDWVRVAGV